MKIINDDSREVRLSKVHHTSVYRKGQRAERRAVEFAKIKGTFSKPGLASSIFGMIILFLFMISFSHYVRTGFFINFSFKSLIEYLSQMPDISLKFSNIDLTAYGDWGIFTFFKSIWNYGFAVPLEFIITIVGMISQAFGVILYLVSVFFI